jgi:hypothetical protein
MIGRAEDLVADRGLRHHGLDEARAVAHGQKMNLPARAAVVQPSLEGDLFAFVRADVFDVYVHKDQGRATKTRKHETY